MKEVTKYFLNKNILFEDLRQVSLKDLNTRKSLEIYSGINLDKYYYAIFVLKTKSRFVLKSAQDLDILYARLCALEGHNFKKRYLLIASADCQICSKAKAFLKDLKWSIINDFV